jgi:putative tricarboxylic transport membrane protein
MSALDGVLYGFGVALSFTNLAAAFAGALAGTAIGVLPGLGPVAGVALILPLTFSLDPTAGLIMMAGIFYGSMYGGSTTAIILNIPGEAASVVTAIDGYKLTKRGRAGAILSIVAVGSFIGGTVAVVGVMLFSPVLANLAMLFGPAEFFALTAGGLVILSRISGGTFAAGFLPMVIGLALGTVGQEAVTGENRFTFGVLQLTEGMSITPVVVGLYGVAEIMRLVEGLYAQRNAARVRLREMLPSRIEWKRAVAPWGRGTILGFIFGLIPGPAATLSSFASYRVEKALSRNRREIGQGAIEGVAGPEAANNSAATGSLVPLLALGVPFTPIGALMISAMMVQGIQPGPLLIGQHPEIFWGLIASAYVANVVLLILNLPLVGMWVTLLRVPLYIFIPVLIILGVTGSYSVRNSMLDVYVLLGMGVLGYVFSKLDFQLAPLVIGLILGPSIEKHLREGLYLSRGDLWVFLSSPISMGLWAGVLLVLVVGAAWRSASKVPVARAFVGGDDGDGREMPDP